MKSKLFILFIVLFNILTSIKSQTVNTQFGQIQGSMNGTVYQFLGIPFAAPPVGTLRWKAPQNPNTWTGVLVTDSFAPVCPQKYYQQNNPTVGTTEGNEDCLYLNVWTPKIATANLPVLVFIHGGGNQQGSASEVDYGTQSYFGKNVAARGNAVVVTIQYRLGPLGFLVYPALEQENANGVSGNYGVLDQILALTWVKKNISNFGGDTTKVMIFGESAGGEDVGNLLTTSLASGLFQRACIESAAPTLGVYADAKNSGIAFVDTFVNTGTDSARLAYMRSLTADTVIKYETAPLVNGVAQGSWKGVVDNVVFTNSPYYNILTGHFNKVPFMIGSNANEMSLSAPLVVTPAMVTGLVNSMVPAAYRAEALLLYPPGATDSAARQSYINLLTDEQFTDPVRITAQCVSQNETAPVWRYFFTYAHSNIPVFAPFGAYHGIELPYVFNTWENTVYTATPQDDSVENVMLRYWVNFANTGNPNGSGLVNWPQYAGCVTDCYMELKASPDGSQCGLRTAESNFWDEVAGYTGCEGANVMNRANGSDDISVYPDPASNFITVEGISQGETGNILVYTITGELLFQQPISKIKTIIDISTLAKGMYFVKSKTNNGIEVLKFIKQ
jgi:para-nitrobenzyl esterase